MKWDACHIKVSESFTFQESGSHGPSQAKIIFISITKEPSACLCPFTQLVRVPVALCTTVHPRTLKKGKHSLRRDCAKSEVTPDEVTWGMPQLYCWTQTLATVQISQDHRMCSATLKYMCWDWASSADDACTMESMSRCTWGT